MALDEYIKPMKIHSIILKYDVLLRDMKREGILLFFMEELTM